MPMEFQAMLRGEGMVQDQGWVSESDIGRVLVEFALVFGAFFGARLTPELGPVAVIGIVFCD